MPALFPNAAAAENFKVGQTVRWYITEREISPYVGKVTEICPGINKIWVTWPVGGKQQHSPEDLIVVTPESYGVSTIKGDEGTANYSSYDTTLSEAQYGTLTPKVIILADKLANKAFKEKEASSKKQKMASTIANKFASEVVEKLSSEILEHKIKGLTDVQTYQSLYPKYENICSDNFMRSAVTRIYKEAFDTGISNPSKTEMAIPSKAEKKVDLDVGPSKDPALKVITNKPNPRTLEDYGYEGE